MRKFFRQHMEWCVFCDGCSAKWMVDTRDEDPPGWTHDIFDRKDLCEKCSNRGKHEQ